MMTLSSRLSIARAVRSLALVALVVVTTAPLGACSMYDKFFNKEETFTDEPAEKLYNEGLFLLNNKRDFAEAAKRFEQVDRQHPYSEWARKSCSDVGLRVL